MHRPRRDWSWTGELSGALGDLGTTLPLAWALAVGAGFPAGRLLLVWGLAYLATAALYRLPVSVQPLKAMAVIVIGLSLPPGTVAAAAVLYGAVLLVIGATGAVEAVARLFSPALVRGVQLGIGLMLLRKAAALAWRHPLVLGHGAPGPLGPALAVIAGLALWALVRSRGRGVLPAVLAGGVALALLAGGNITGAATGGTAPTAPLAWRWPDLAGWTALVPLLILPQLPLTLGNAVIAADDACHLLWGGRAARVSRRRLACSIGLLDVACGVLGGFPVCHGAGGIAAHHRFGARTWRAPVAVGLLLVAAGLAPGAAGVLLRLPVPLLAAMLGLVSLSLVGLLARLDTAGELAVAVTVGGLGLLTRNLTVAVLAGFALERLLRRTRLPALPNPWPTPEEPS